MAMQGGRCRKSWRIESSIPIENEHNSVQMGK